MSRPMHALRACRTLDLRCRPGADRYSACEPLPLGTALTASRTVDQGAPAHGHTRDLRICCPKPYQAPRHRLHRHRSGNIHHRPGTRRAELLVHQALGQAGAADDRRQQRGVLRTQGPLLSTLLAHRRQVQRRGARAARRRTVTTTFQRPRMQNRNTGPSCSAQRLSTRWTCSRSPATNSCRLPVRKRCGGAGIAEKGFRPPADRGARQGLVPGQVPLKCTLMHSNGTFVRTVAAGANAQLHGEEGCSCVKARCTRHDSNTLTVLARFV